MFLYQSNLILIFNKRQLTFVWNSCDTQVCVGIQHRKTFGTEHFALFLGWRIWRSFHFFYYIVILSIRKILLLQWQVTEVMYSSSVLSDKVKVALLYVMTLLQSTWMRIKEKNHRPVKVMLTTVWLLWRAVTQNKLRSQGKAQRACMSMLSTTEN